MPFNFQPPATYLVTSGETTRDTTPSSREFGALLSLVERAVAARISLVQLREKNLTAHTLYELALRAAAITKGSATRLVVNDRADIAIAARADGVHLTTHSLDASIIRRMTAAHGDASNSILLIGASAHTLDEARAARDSGADFAVFGPVFDTPSKRPYGAPPGLAQLRAAARALAPFPLFAIGGIDAARAPDALRAGAQGIAAIRLFTEAHSLAAVVRAIEDAADRRRPDDINDRE